MGGEKSLPAACPWPHGKTESSLTGRDLTLMLVDERSEFEAFICLETSSQETKLKNHTEPVNLVRTLMERLGIVQARLLKVELGQLQ